MRTIGIEKLSNLVLIMVFDTPTSRLLLRLYVGALLPMSKPVLERIGQGLAEHEKRWPKRPIDLLGASEHEGNVLTHHLTISLEERDDQKHLDVDMEIIQHFGGSIRTRRASRLTRDFDAIQRILALIGTIDQESHLHCQIRWAFPKDRFETLVRLPLMRFDVPSIPFVQVSGVRLTTSSDDDVILDLLDDESIDVTASFTFDDFFSMTTAQNVLRSGEDLIRPLVIEQKKGDSDESED